MRHRSKEREGIVIDDDQDQDFSSCLDDAEANNSEAIRRLVDEFGPGLTNYARRKGVADPEGMANAALFGALQNLDNFRGRDRSTFRSYLYQILNRRVVDEVRYASSRPRTVPDLGSEFSAHLIDPTASSFDERVVDEDYIDALLTKLTAEQRQILQLRLIDDLSIQETADRTGRSITAVKALQRRAISSLRIAAAAMVVLALVFGLRLLLSAGEQSIIVENGPAGQSTGSPDDGSGDVTDPSADDGEEVGLPQSDPDSEDDDRTTPIIEGASSVSVATEVTTTPSTTENTEAPETTGAPTTSEPPATEAPVDPTSPCTVITDGSPAVGEIAFVTYNFSGPFSLLRGASAYIIGRSGESAMLSGFGSTDNVSNGRRLAFEVSPNMFNENDRFKPRSTFGGDDIKTNCEIGDPVERPLCSVSTDGSPEAGEDATVTYTLSGIFRQLLNERWTYVIGQDGESAMQGGRTKQVLDGATHTFTIDGSMWRDGELTIRSSFRNGEGFIQCQVT